MEKKNDKLWWKPAIVIFGNVSSWIIGPIILALIIGKYLDKKYDSDPWFFLGLTGVAFFISIFGIVKILKKYLKEIEKPARPPEEGAGGEAKEKKLLEKENLNK